ncbi:MAG: hypothetical protein U0L17_02505 [Acutalibacteraceae bacterium]|nr:hypothetical protein [Acutalibacteraceae bacterium]
MKKTLILFILMICFFNINAKAETFEFDLDEETNLYAQMYEDYKADELVENSPEEVKDFFGNFNITPDNPFSFSELFTKDGLEYLKEYILNSVTSPLKNAGIILVSIIICAFCNSLCDNNLQVNHAMDTICILSVISAVILPISSVITESVNTVSTVTVFMGVFIPIFAGILIASLKTQTAAVYSSVMFFVCEAISYCCKNIVLPFANCFTALSVASGISGSSRIGGVTRIFKKAAYIVITTAMAVFLTVLSIQSVVGSTADTATTKTAKFFISSFVPIIGPSISESLGSLKGCIGLLKSSVGIYAVIAVLIMLIPVIIKIIILKLTLTFSADVSEMFSVNAIKFVLESLNQALSIVLAVVLCSGVMFVFSITIIAVAGGSV